MGKALVIKGADFSEVCIDIIPLGGRTYLSSNNPIFTKDGYISSSSKVWSPARDTTTYFWPVSMGDILVSRGNMLYNADPTYFYFVTIEDNTPIYHKVAGCIIGDKNFIVSKSPINGYVAIIVENGERMVDLPETFLTKEFDSELLEAMQITKDNKVHSINGYITANGSWGSGSTTYSFPVIEGEKLVVNAPSSSSAIVGLYSKSLQKNTEGFMNITTERQDVDMIEGGYRVSIPQGESRTIIIPHDGYAAIFAKDGGKDVFPDVQVTIE